MDNYERLQFAAGQVSKMIQLEKAWREGQIEIQGEVITFTPELKAKFKANFVSLRAATIDALNNIRPNDYV